MDRCDGHSASDAYQIRFFERSDGTAPARDYLRACPKAARVKLTTTLISVAAAPPHKFSGGGRWEIMHGEMRGWYEARSDGPRRVHYRLFCLLDAAKWLVVVTGMSKPFGSRFRAADYRRVRALGDEFRAERTTV